jgi:hypothetical protein
MFKPFQLIRMRYIHINTAQCKERRTTCRHVLAPVACWPKRSLRLIANCLKLGVVEDGRVTRCVGDAPQRAVISPTLAIVYTQIFQNDFDLVPIEGADQFPVKIGFGPMIDPLRPRAIKAFEEFFFSRARSAYPQYDFARMNDDQYDEYGANLALFQITDEHCGLEFRRFFYLLLRLLMTHHAN